MTRKSFILYHDSLCILDKLSIEQKGLLFDAIYRYQITGEVPELDPITDLVFTPFLNQFKRDEIKYTETINERSDSGLKGNLKRWHPDLYERVEKKEITFSQAIEIAKSRKTSLSDNSNRYPSPPIANVANVADNVSDSDSDSDSDSVSKNKKENNLSGDEIVFQKWMKEKFQRVSKMKKPITLEQIKSLKHKYGDTLVIEKLTAMENSAELHRKYICAYTTCNNWCKMQKEKDLAKASSPIPNVVVSRVTNQEY